MNRDIRVAGWAGIAAFATGALVVFLTGTPTQPYPDWSWTDQQIAHHFAVQRTNVAAQFYLANFGFALVVWFAAGLKHLLHAATGPSVHLSLIIPCAAVQAVTLQQTNGMWWVAALRPTVDAHNARLAYEICIAVGYTAVHFFMSFMIFATATQLRRGTVFPRFWATTSYVAAAIVMCGTFELLATRGVFAPTTIVSAIPYLTFYLWVLITGILMVRGRGHQPSPSAP